MDWKILYTKSTKWRPHKRIKCRQNDVNLNKFLFENRIHMYKILGSGDYLWDGFRYH